MKRIMLSLLLTIAGNAVYAQTPPPADTEAESGARSAEPRPEDGPAGLRYGDYRYDPSGNIAAIGQNYYTYDTLGRVKAAGVQYDGFVQTRTYTYDVYGNRTSDGPNSFPANAQNNRYTGAAYDPAGTGNMTSWQPPGANGTRQYNYDALDQITRETADLPGTSNDPWAVHIYTADEERLWTFHSTGQSSWTIRDLNGSVLREYRTDGVSWSVHRDYVYRSGQLLAARTPAGTHHYSLDHLGTPRVVTDDAGVVIGEHAYWPFGSELTGGAQPREGALRFTGHERDADLADVSSDGLDYMHARRYSSMLGRFVSPDEGEDWNPTEPQSWNLYSYVRNNPTGFIDGTGESRVIYWIRSAATGFWRRATRRQAVKTAASGAAHGVIVEGAGSSKKARKVLKDTRRGKEKKHHEAHPGGAPSGPEKHRDHWQYLDADGGQVNYELGSDLWSLLPYVGWLAAESIDVQADTDMQVVRESFDILAQDLFGKDFEDLTPDEKKKVLNKIVHPDLVTDGVEDQAAKP